MLFSHNRMADILFNEVLRRGTFLADEEERVGKIASLIFDIFP